MGVVRYGSYPCHFERVAGESKNLRQDTQHKIRNNCFRPRGKNHAFFTSRPPKAPFQSRKTPSERQKQAVFYLSAFQQALWDYSETQTTDHPQRKVRFGLVPRDRSRSIPPTASRRAPPSHEAEGGHAIQISPSSPEGPMGVRKIWVISLSFRASRRSREISDKIPKTK